LAHRTPAHDTKLLLKAVFDKTVFVKFKISINFLNNIDEHIQNNQKSKEKSMPAYRFKNFKKNICKPKVLKLLPNVCDFQKRKPYPGYGFKNL
jgi:hypothetical protein